MDVNWKKALLKIGIGIGFILLMIFTYKFMLVTSISKSPLYQNAPMCDKIPPELKENQTSAICKVNNLSWIICTRQTNNSWFITPSGLDCNNVSIMDVRK